MIKQRHLLITGIIIIILIGLYFLLSAFNLFQEKNITPSQEQRISGNKYLMDDDVTGLIGCTNPIFLSQFSGYKLVKKINPDNPEKYDIYIYNMSLDLNTIMDKEGKLKNETELKKAIIKRITQKIQEKFSWFKEIELSTLHETYRLVDIIFSDDGEICGLGSEDRNDEIFDLPRTNNTLINNLNLFLGELLSGNIDLKYLSAIQRQPFSYPYILAHKTYKKGILVIEGGGMDGWAINLSYIKNIGSKLYYLSGDPFMTLSRDNESEIDFYDKIYNNNGGMIKDMKCSTKTSCENAIDTYLQRLLDDQETLPEYKEAYDNFMANIDYVFN